MRLGYMLKEKTDNSIKRIFNEQYDRCIKNMSICATCGKYTYEYIVDIKVDDKNIGITSGKIYEYIKNRLLLEDMSFNITYTSKNTLLIDWSKCIDSSDDLVKMFKTDENNNEEDNKKE